MLRKILSVVLALAIAISPEYAYAQQLAGTLALPAPGSMVQPSDPFQPAVLRGLMIDSENPLHFDFIVDAGDEKMDQAALKDTTTRLVNYFLASMTVPQGDLWVNLSPVEKDRIIPDGLNKTELGRDLLSQDYLLKQLTATMFNPDQSLGKEFWGKVYAQAREKFGTSEISTDTFNKVWIVPQSAKVFEKGNTVYITGGHLKVMLEADYLAESKSLDVGRQTSDEKGIAGPATSDVLRLTSDSGLVQASNSSQELSRNITREIILPAIEKEVNEGRNFAGLRQMFYSLVLAQWYQDVFKDSVINKAYAGHNKVAGIDLNDPQNREVIFQQYLDAYKKGVFSFIREEIDRVSQESLPRKYFSGGAEWNHPVRREPAVSVLASENQYRAAVELAPADRANPAMAAVKLTDEWEPLDLDQPKKISFSDRGGAHEITVRRMSWGVQIRERGEVPRNIRTFDGQDGEAILFSSPVIKDRRYAQIILGWSPNGRKTVFNIRGLKKRSFDLQISRAQRADIMGPVYRSASARKKNFRSLIGALYAFSQKSEKRENIIIRPNQEIASLEELPLDAQGPRASGELKDLARAWQGIGNPFFTVAIAPSLVREKRFYVDLAEAMRFLPAAVVLFEEKFAEGAGAQERPLGVRFGDVGIAASEYDEGGVIQRVALVPAALMSRQKPLLFKRDALSSESAMTGDTEDQDVTIGKKTMPLSVARQAVEMIRAELEKGTLPLVMEEPSESPFYGVFREIFGAVARQTGGLRVSVERYDGRDSGSNYVKDNVSLALSPASRVMIRLGRKNLEGQLIQRFKEALFRYKDASAESAMKGRSRAEALSQIINHLTKENFTGHRIEFDGNAGASFFAVNPKAQLQNVVFRNNEDSAFVIFTLKDSEQITLLLEKDVVAEAVNLSRSPGPLQFSDEFMAGIVNAYLDEMGRDRAMARPEEKFFAGVRAGLAPVKVAKVPGELEIYSFEGDQAHLIVQTTGEGRTVDISFRVEGVLRHLRAHFDGQGVLGFSHAVRLLAEKGQWSESAMQGQADKFVDDQRFQQKAGSGLYEKLPNVSREKIDLVLAVTQFLELLTNFSQSEEQYDSIAARRALLENPRAVEVILDYLDEVKPGQDDGYPSAMGQIKTVYHEEKARRAIRAFENTLIERLFERGILRINNTNIGIQGRSDKDAVAITFDGVRLTGKPDKNEIAFIYRPNHAYAVTQLVSNNDSRFYKGGVRWGLPTEVDSKGNAIKNPDKTLKMSPAGALRAFQMAYSEANGLSLTQNPKNIISGIAYAGGKTFIGVSLDTLSPADKAAFLTAWGRAAVDIGLIPKYVAGPDVNMTPADMDVIVKAIQERYVEHLKIGLKKVREFGVDPRTFKIEDYNRLIAGDGFLQDDFIQEMRRKVIAALNEGRLDLDTLEFDGQLKTEILKIIGAGATGGTEENGGLPHAKMAVTGHGVIVGAHAVMQYIKDNPEFRAQYHLEPLYQLMLKGKVKTAVQGAGDVGASAALKLARLGYLVVAISDVNGTVHKPEGFTVEELQRLVNSDSKTRNVLNWMPQGAGVKHLAASDLFDGNKVDLDLLVPAAVSKAINKGNLSLLRGADHPDVVSGVRSPLVITEGANISFVDVVADLHQMGILAFNGMALNFGGVFTSYQQDLLMHRFLPAETRRISLKRADGTDILSGASVKVVETVTGRFPGVADASLAITDGVVGQSNVPQVPQGTLIDVWGTDIYSQGDRLPLEGVSVQRSFVISDDQVRGVTLDQDGRVISVANVAGVKEGDVLTFVDNMDEVKKILYTRIEEISRRVNTMVAEVVNLSGMTPSLAAIKIAGVLEEKKGMILRDVNGKYRQATFGIIQGYRDKGYVLSENIERNIAAIELAGQEVLVMGINGRNIVFGPDGRVASGGEAPGEKKESAMSLDTFVHKANLALEKAGPLEFHPVISGVPQTWRMSFSVQIAPAREQTRFDSPLNEPAFFDKGSEGGRDVPVKFIIAREDGYQPEALVVTMASLWMTSFHQPLGEERSKVLEYVERHLPATTIAERLRRVLGVESAMAVTQPEMQGFSRQALALKEAFNKARSVQGTEALKERQWRVLDKMFAQGIQWFLDRGALDGLVSVPASDVLAVSLEALRDLEEIEGVSSGMPEMLKGLVEQASEFFMDILEQMDQKMRDGLGRGRFQTGNVLPDAALSGEPAMARIVENVEFPDASFVWGENVQVVNPSGETFYAGDFLETIARYSRKEGGRVLLKNMRLTFSDAGRHAKIAIESVPPASLQHESARLQALDEDISRVQSSHFPLFSTLGEMRNALWSNDLLRAVQIARELALQKRPDDPLFNDVIDQVIAYAQSRTGQVHGGIDLNDVRMSREGEIMTAPLSEAGLKEMLMNAPGLRPIIINITPIKDVRPLLGLATDGFVPVADSDAAVPPLARVREEELVGV